MYHELVRSRNNKVIRISMSEEVQHNVETTKIEEDVNKMGRYVSDVNREHTAVTLYNSTCWLTYSIIQLVVAVSLVFFIIYDLSRHRYTIDNDRDYKREILVLESIITAMIGVDLSIKMCIYGTPILSNIWYRIDACILLLLVLILVFMLSFGSSIVSEEIDALLLAGRCCIQIYRLLYHSIVHVYRRRVTRGIRDIHIDHHTDSSQHTRGDDRLTVNQMRERGGVGQEEAEGKGAREVDASVSVNTRKYYDIYL